MDLGRVLRSIRRRQWAIALLCLSAVVNVVAVTYLVEEKYEASVLVLVRPRDDIRATAGGETRRNILDFPVGISIPYEAPSRTFTEMLKSRRVAEQIVRHLGLDTVPGPHAEGPLRERWKRIRDGAKEYLKRGWDIARFGRVIEGSRFDKAVADLQKGLLVTPTLKSYVFEISCRWPDPVLARRIVDDATRVFLEVVGTLSTAEAKSVREFLELRLADAERQLVTSRAALREFKERNRSVLFTEETTEKIKTIGSLEVSLEKTEAELTGLLRRFTPEHPAVVKAQGEKDSLAAGIDQLKRGLENLPEKEAQLARLKLSVKTDESTYEFIKKEYDEARIREAQRSSDIGIVSPAFASTSPVRPIKIYYAVTALAIALMFGIGAAVLSDSLRATLTTIDDVEQALDLPVLATIPKTRWDAR